MAKYIFVYHGGKMPESQEEGAKVMAQWKGWLGGMGDAVVDGGNPVGMSSTVHSDGSVTSDGGSNPTSGYSLVSAEGGAACRVGAGRLRRAALSRLRIA